MFNFEILKNRFDYVYYDEKKVYVEGELVPVLEYLKNTPEFNYDILTTIVAVDLREYIELIYQLYSTKNNEVLEVSFKAYGVAPTVVNVYKSAHYDECEIYDLFGVSFSGNENLKRLFMPATWIGHPLLKSYEMCDERLAWND